MKKNKIFYYIKAYARLLLPARSYKKIIASKKKNLSATTLAFINARVDYYNKLEAGNANAALLPKTIADLKELKSPKAYFIDTYQYAQHFPSDLKANFLFGDITYTESIPSIQKSRPIHGDNKNATLLKLDKNRHYKFVKDTNSFSQKKNMLVGRGVFRQEHRIAFMEKYFDHPLCDLGQINDDSGKAEWTKPKIAIAEHFEYKFILSLEGYDVASNLKWIMNSNSIAVMPEPKFETWFMEGKLIPNVHYICIKDDYSDLETRLQYYINHPAEAANIIEAANAYVQPFIADEHEELISLLVLEKYFLQTGQL